MLRGICVGLLATIAMVGCDREQVLVLPEAILEGSVTLNGKPVPHALVLVAGENAPAAQGFADAEGRFRISNCASGLVKIGINTDAGRGNMMGAVMASQHGGNSSAAPNFVDIPKKYFDPSTSGIETQIANAEGVNTFDIKLK